MEVDNSAATSAVEPPGDSTAEEAADAAPPSWQETLKRTWENTAGKVDLKDIQIGFVSTPELLFEQANRLFEAAHLAVAGRQDDLLPLPEHNADGTALALDLSVQRYGEKRRFVSSMTQETMAMMRNKLLETTMVSKEMT